MQALFSNTLQSHWVSDFLSQNLFKRKAIQIPRCKRERAGGRRGALKTSAQALWCFLLSPFWFWVTEQKCHQQSGKGHNIRREDDPCVSLPFLESMPSTTEVQQNEIKKDGNRLGAEQRSFPRGVLADTPVLELPSVSDALVCAGARGGAHRVKRLRFFTNSNFSHTDQRRGQWPYLSHPTLTLFLAQTRWQTSLDTISCRRLNKLLSPLCSCFLFYKQGWWQCHLLELLSRLMRERIALIYLCLWHRRSQQMREATNTPWSWSLEMWRLLWSKKTGKLW